MIATGYQNDRDRGNGNPALASYSAGVPDGGETLV